MSRYTRARKAITALHVPYEQEVEVWHDNTEECPTPVIAVPMWSETFECPGHDVKMQVCRECGHEHDGEQPVFRPWPCPTVRVFMAAVRVSPEGTE